MTDQVDIEEAIGKCKEDYTNYEFIAQWKSGRLEKLRGPLNKDGSIPKKIQKKSESYRLFPTVTSVHVRKL